MTRRQRSRVVSLVAYGLAAVCLVWSIHLGDWSVLLWFFGSMLAVVVFVVGTNWWIGRGDDADR